MQILHLQPEPFYKIRYRVSAISKEPHATLPFYRATVDGLPEGLDAIIAAGDLQGYEITSSTTPAKLLGDLLAGEIEVLRMRGELPPREKTAVIVAGDLQPRADEADVRAVWFALGDVCRWVAGVAGNHDAFGDAKSAGEARLALDRSDLHFLDETIVSIDGLSIGGISGAVGRPGDLWARTEKEFAAALARLANRGLDLLISHDGPNVAGTTLAGWPSVRLALESAPRTLVIRGHDPWPTPLAMLGNGTQVLNVEGCVFVLSRG